MRAATLSALLLAACGSPADPYADVPEGCIVWSGDQQWGTAHDDRAGVAIARNGDVLIHGYEDGLLHVENIEPAGLARGFVERLAGRRPAWRWELPAPDGGAVDVLQVREDGTIQLAGRARATVAPGLRMQYQLVLGELDPSGELLELQQLGEPPSEHPRQLSTADGWNVVAGYHEVYVPTNYVAAREDPFLVTWRDGDMANARMIRFETSWTDLADGVAIDPAGQVAIAVTSPGSAPSGAFVRRYDPAGQVLATEWIAQGPLEALAAVRRLPDGDFLVAGSTWQSLGGPQLGNEDVFVARFDPTLSSRRWLRKVGTSSSEIVIDMAVADDGRAWILGETLGSFDAAPNRGQTDLFVAALAADGEVRWISQYGSAGDERPARIAVDACESVLVAGATDGALIEGSEPAGFDAFVLRAGP